MIILQEIRLPETAFPRVVSSLIGESYTANRRSHADYFDLLDADGYYLQDADGYELLAK